MTSTVTDGRSLLLIFNAGASIGALIAPLTIPILAKMFGWEMAFIVIGGLGFIWMGFWVFMYDAPSKSKHVNQAAVSYTHLDDPNILFSLPERLSAYSF